jgi:DNA polymerase-3 subunit epsilon
MTGWIEQPMAAFDLESTGVSVESDRIVTACVARLGGHGPTDIWHALADPGVDIPDEATAIHGITTEKARLFGIPAVLVVAETVDRLGAAWGHGLPVVGFNVAFDLTMLDRESRRWSNEPVAVDGPVLDPLVIDRHLDRYRAGPRTLAAVAAHYGVQAEGAHDAVGDATTAHRVMLAIGRRYPELATMTLPELTLAQGLWHAGWAASFRDFLVARGRTDDLPDGAWPLRPWAGRAA